MPTHTIAENLQRLQAAKTAIGNAIVAKGGTVGANDGLEEFPTDIATIPTGGITPAEPKDVNFYDYDGTCVYSYTADEFAELTAMPANPTHSGLTAQGWNWSLSDAKTYVADYGKLDVGQMYITSDGKTRLYIELRDGRLKPWLKLYLNANSELDIDWGDGSTHSMFTSTSAGHVNEMHEYANAGEYVIAITVVNGSFEIQEWLFSDNKISYTSSDIVYMSSVKRVEIGAGISVIGRSALNNYDSLSSITIPSSITGLGSRCLASNSVLSTIIIPTSAINTLDICYYSTGLMKVVFPNSITRLSDFAFSNNPALRTFIIPDSITLIGRGAINSCEAINSIIIPKSVTNLESGAFSKCYSLGYVKFTSETPPIIANIDAWNYVPSDCYILVPLNALDDYLNTTNMPDDSTYLYLCYAKYASGAELPATSTDGYSLTWYATKDDARAGTNPITVGNGKEVYAVGV